MRRSKRLATKISTNCSETEGSSQEEVADVKDHDVEALISKDHDFVTDKTPSHVATSTSDHEDKGVDDNSDGDERDEDVDSLSNVRITSLQEDEEQEEDFITLSSEFKTKLKE